MRTPILLLLLASFLAPASSQDLDGGAPASHGRVPRFELDSWIPGAPSGLTFTDLPTSFAGGAAFLSATATALSVPGVAGLVIADPFNGAIVAMGQSISLVVPASLHRQDLIVQGILFDTVSGLSMTDATRVRLLRPLAMVGNQRQTANSLSVVDVASRQVIQRLGDSENGSIAFSPDRTRSYVCEPGGQRNRVVVYDLTASPIAVLTTVSTTGGVRYRGDFAPDGRRLYVPVHDGVDVIDTDPTSATYHTVLAKIPTPITGNAGSIFTGPIDVAVTPDGRKLFIAYGENLPTWPAPASVGVVDLTPPTYPHRIIPVQCGGVVTLLGNLATRTSVRVSPDGRYAYVLEYGFTPGAYAIGFANGSLLNVVDVANEVEVTAIATGGFGQSSMEMDFLGRRLWVPQTDVSNLGEVLHFDVDRRSATRNTLVRRVLVDPTPYYATTGPRGVAVTADGGVVLVSLVEDGRHPTPELVTIDARAGVVFGPPIVVESLPATVACQR